MANSSGVPKPAKYSVKCDQSSSGKHIPTTKETKVDGQHVKFKVCTACGFTLK